MGIDVPFSQDSLSLQKYQAILYLPAKDNEEMSFLVQCVPQTEVLVTGISRTKSSLDLECEITYIFTVKTIQPDFSQFAL